MIESWPVLLAFVAVNILTASSGAIFSPGRWYRDLDKPPWTPPNWLFGPAWTLLFAMIAYSGYVFYMSAEPSERLWPLAIYGVQLVFNGLWSALFFGARRVDLAFFDALAMIGAISANIAAFATVSTEAAALLVPYLVWVTFAAALNFNIMRRNAPRRRTA